MSQLPFDTFFQSVTGNTPCDYQSRLAGNDSGTAWAKVFPAYESDRGTTC
jgi:hypothetical protein